MKKLGLESELDLSDSDSDEVSHCLSEAGSYIDGNLRVNSSGHRIFSPDIQFKSQTSEWNLTDIEPMEKVLGKGSFGTVRLAKHKHKKDQLFALKVVQFKGGGVEKKTIREELTINQSVECPYVVKCYEFFFMNNEFSILMEYMDCGTLEDLLKEVKQIPEPYLAAICNQLLKGLFYLHHENNEKCCIIHRDLKPPNLLINQRGQIKISDFGVSKAIESTYGNAKTSAGTQLYMAPERIIEGEEHNIKSDIWSLGLILLECATGQLPHSLYSIPDKSPEYLFLVAVADRAPPTAPSDKFSKEFCSFISSCLEKDPKKRLSSRKLREHPFVNKYDNEQVDLASYFKKALHPLPSA